MANSIYTRDNFLHAIAYYPRFCDYNNADYHPDIPIELCKKALSTFAAHMIIDTHDEANEDYELYRRGLSRTYTLECDDVELNICNTYHDGKSFFPASYGISYNARGAMNLKTNTHYGRFSKAFYDDDHDGSKLLDHPEYVQ